MGEGFYLHRISIQRQFALGWLWRDFNCEGVDPGCLDAPEWMPAGSMCSVGSFMDVVEVKREPIPWRDRVDIYARERH